jgi:hypothetical protein
MRLPEVSDTSRSGLKPPASTVIFIGCFLWRYPVVKICRNKLSSARFLLLGIIRRCLSLLFYRQAIAVLYYIEVAFGVCQIDLAGLYMLVREWELLCINIIDVYALGLFIELELIEGGFGRI